MFRFRLGRIPVHVHFSHLLFSTLLAYSWLPAAREPGAWPGPVLASNDAPGHLVAMIGYLTVCSAVVFLAVLIHELGHAVVSAAFGYRPAIELAFLGGRTFTNPNETVPWFKQVALTLAGPASGLALGLLSWVSVWALSAGNAAYFFFRSLGEVSVFWSALNLLPVTPLDGGHIALAILQRAFGRRGFLLAQLLSLFCAGLLAVVSWAALGPGALMLVFLFGAWGARSLVLIHGYFKGELPPSAPNHPVELAYRHAVERFRQGQYASAQTLADRALQWDMQPTLRSRFQHLSGWLALKTSQGRAALDHFSQVSNGVHVEPQALAAAFSLVGDEPRALTFWELAWRESKDATILHEYAGALIRSGDMEKAAQLPGVDLPAAYACAARPLLERGEPSRAASLEEERLALRPTPQAAYDAACAHARAGQVGDALRLLECAKDLGFSNLEYARTDEDLVSLHREARFHAWLAALQQSLAK